ncbi:carbon-monoxide dehydrogenase medium subunit/6-hydroxypseudooxynicotine dehydrogenase subunit alpha [Nocardioides alpinus]|uniref:Xanthine dehydrogenase family protein subunit M n=2 Tax=Nocardioides TaxID=1839 RepID=A0A4V1RNC3_9ACTN|nr:MULTISPECIES: xanthine dehydrogenase family protein subunit M [Nocardioides]PKH38498.1 xanthine dehydrogenase family protein subunit M [Nocardioides alpinus]RYC05357.1 xanthine dehydrogenase family protein subunit M [Nocardioides zhouii]SFB47708.1 carbon-monoxide dehydrogenase medium subunit/6-hydroxypseudooxynicotine dehydrogenase subunit alpha [Nocardioides alpinus]
MKPPPFDYVVATSLDQAIDLVSSDEDAKFIAGGQSLIPLLSLRFARPTLLVDISRLSVLRGVRSVADALNIGASTRHADIERLPVVRECAPLLSAAAGWVAHAQIRNRGTFGGAVAHSDSAAEFPAALLAMGATIVTRSSSGERRIPSTQFFGAHFQTALQHGELVVAVEVPTADRFSRWGFSEFARRKGDYAIGGAAVSARLNEDGECTSVRAGLIAAGPGPTSAEGLEETLVGHLVDESAVDAAVAQCERSLSPESNVHGSKEYRRAVVAESLRRALHQAFDLGGTQDERRSA